MTEPCTIPGQNAGLGRSQAKFHQPAGRNEVRRGLYALRDDLRRHQGRNRLVGCGRMRISPTVQIWLEPGRRAAFSGVLHCGLLWGCPVCAQKLVAHRANDLQKGIETWGGDRMAMLTVTIRHGRSDELADTRRVSAAWQRTISGKAWQEFKSKLGIAGYVRALEVTHGANGWHPHLHILLFFEKALSDAQLQAANNWFSERWQRNVERCLGADFVPSDERGVSLIRCSEGQYIAKMNLELVSHQTKKGRYGSRSHWQIAADLAAKGSPSDAILWRDLQANLFRKRCLTWSRGLRAKLGLGAEETDAEVLATEDLEDHIVEIQGVIWDSIARVNGVLAELLEAAESGKREAVEAVIQRVTGRASALEAVSLRHVERPKLAPLPANQLRTIAPPGSDLEQLSFAVRHKRAVGIRALFVPKDNRAAILLRATELHIPSDAIRAAVAIGRLTDAGSVDAFGARLRRATIARSVRAETELAFDIRKWGVEKKRFVVGGAFGREALAEKMAKITGLNLDTLVRVTVQQAETTEPVAEAPTDLEMDRIAPLFRGARR